VDLFAKNIHATNITADHGYFTTLSASSTIYGETVATDELCVGTSASRKTNSCRCSAQTPIYKTAAAADAPAIGGSGAPASQPAPTAEVNADTATSTTSLPEARQQG
jgi:hypothetical protein